LKSLSQKEESLTNELDTDAEKMKKNNSEPLLGDKISRPSQRILIDIVKGHDKDEIVKITGCDNNIHRTLSMHLVSICILSGLMVGLTASFGKIFLNITSFNSLDPVGWLFFVVTSSTILLNFVNINLALGLYSQLLVMPIQESCIIFGVMTGGLFIMDEIQFYTLVQLLLILCGTMMCVAGICWKLINTSEGCSCDAFDQSDIDLDFKKVISLLE
jgi:uncharacterized membrane protein